MKIIFYGGVGEVTGSKHLVEIGGMRILLDCGFHQGHRKEARELNSSLPFDPATIDTVVLSHAHLDHCGMLPLLVKQGYAGKIYATPATKDVAEWILKDAAHIQMQDAEHLRRHASPGAALAEPLYSLDDIPRVMERFVIVPYVRNSGEWHQLEGANGRSPVQLKFYDAGHILGSSVIVLEAGNERIVFTGDLGRDGAPLIHDPEYVHEEATVLVSECTYGGRIHQNFADAKARLRSFVQEVIEHKSKLIVPSFALGRTQELMYLLHRLTDDGEIPRIPIFVDSPLASHITDVYRKHEDDFDRETWAEFGVRGDEPLEFRNLTFAQSSEESRALNHLPGPMVIIAGSGMCENGRIQHHLRHGLGNPRNIVLITGFQAIHTLGRRLVEGEKTVRIYDEFFEVRARVERLNELSAHADRNELLKYAEHIKGLKHVYLVHGEYSQAAGLKSLMEERHSDWQVTIPERGQVFEEE